MHRPALAGSTVRCLAAPQTQGGLACRCACLAKGWAPSRSPSSGAGHLEDHVVYVVKTSNRVL